jgi:hypothetical protein
MFAIDLLGLVLGAIELVHRYFYPDQYKPEPPPPPKEDENVVNTTATRGSLVQPSPRSAPLEVY